MFRFLKKVICAMLGLAAIQQASAFSVYGPAETWQTPTLDYLTRYWYGDTELGGPKNFNLGSRLNVPIITYGFDYTFLDYFGAQGVAAVDSAMNELNNLPGASETHLKKFLTQDNQVINYTAQALTLLDLKSTVMWLMMEHMGLIGETHVWDLHARTAEPGTCQFAYIVINRSYDPVSYDPSAYVNGVLYSYEILEGCPIGVSVADAIEFPADLASTAHFTFTAVATFQSLQPGGFYLGITRDDMGGLAYLYNKGRYVYEGLDSNAVAAGFGSTWSPVVTTATNTTGGTATTNSFSGILGGVEKINFVKVNFDSLLGANFNPIIYNYTIPMITNGMLGTLHVTRTITAPDILFTAADLVGTAYPLQDPLLTRSVTFVSNNLASPGGGITASVISPVELITFNNVTPIYYNQTSSFLDESTSAFPILLWGSFNGSTNAPIIYPTGTSIADLYQQVISGGTSLPVGTYNPLSALNSNSTNSSASTVASGITQ